MKEHQLTMSQTLFWAIVWIGVLAIVWVPSTAEAVSQGLGLNIRQPIDTIVYISILALFYLMYRMHVKQEQAEQHLTQLVRKLAIRDAKNK
jgi:hypothetical protein